MSTLSKVEDYATKHDVNGIVSEIDNLKTDNVNVNLGVIGEFSSGKSTLLNGLIGRELLPTEVNPTTGNTVYLETQEGIEEPHFYVHSEDDRVREEIDKETFSDYAVGDKEGDPRVVLPPQAFLGENYHIIDTPGLQSLDEIHADITIGALNFLDGAILCLDATQGGLKQSVKELLERDELERTLQQLVIVLTHSDQVTETEKSEIKERLVSDLNDILGKDHEVPVRNRIVFTSAPDALNGDGDGNLEELQRVLTNTFLANQRMLQQLHIEREAELLGEELIAILEERLNGLDLNDEQLQKKEEEIKSNIEKWENHRDQAKTKFRRFSQRLESKLNGYATEYSALLMNEDAVDKHVDQLIEDIEKTVEEQIDVFLDEFLEENNTDLQSTGASDELRAKIKNELDKADMLAFVTGEAVFALLTMGAGQATKSGKLLPKVARKVGKYGKAGKWISDKVLQNEKVQKLAGKAGKKVKNFLDSIDPAEYVRDFTREPIYKFLSSGEIKRKLNRSMSRILDTVEEEISEQLNDAIYDKYLRRLEASRENLKQIRSEKQKSKEETVEYKRNLEADLKELRELLS